MYLNQFDQQHKSIFTADSNQESPPNPLCLSFLISTGVFSVRANQLQL